MWKDNKKLVLLCEGVLNMKYVNLMV